MGCHANPIGRKEAQSTKRPEAAPRFHLIWNDCAGRERFRLRAPARGPIQVGILTINRIRFCRQMVWPPTLDAKGVSARRDAVSILNHMA